MDSFEDGRVLYEDNISQLDPFEYYHDLFLPFQCFQRESSQVHQ